jgi:hypothetical protein
MSAGAYNITFVNLKKASNFVTWPLAIFMQEKIAGSVTIGIVSLVRGS